MVILLLSSLLILQQCLASISPLQVGVTHVEDWEPWSRHQESVQRAVTLLKNGNITWQNQGVVGAGGMWLPSPERPSSGYDWSHLDYRVQMMRSASTVPGRLVLRLFNAPAWMCNMTSRSHTTKVGNAPLRRDRYDDFASFCATIARRYPDVTHYEVWNELLGFIGNWSFRHLDGMTVNAADYTKLFVKVSTAIKSVNPSAKVGGPYVPISQGQLPPGSWEPVDTKAQNSWCSGTWGSIQPALLEFIKYFVTHAKGHYDFFAMDGHLAYESYWVDGHHYTRPSNNDSLASTAIFPTVTRWVRERSGLDPAIPIWWAEFYPVPCIDTGMYGPMTELWPLDQQLAVFKKALTEISEPALGVEVALNWAAQANPNCIAGLYNDTSAPNGGHPTPFYDIVRDVNRASLALAKAREDTSGCWEANARSKRYPHCNSRYFNWYYAYGWYAAMDPPGSPSQLAQCATQAPKGFTLDKRRARCVSPSTGTTSRPPVRFQRITTGRDSCGDVGMAPLTDRLTCNAAGRALGVGGYYRELNSQASGVQYCYWDPHPPPPFQAGKLVWRDEASTGVGLGNGRSNLQPVCGATCAALTLPPGTAPTTRSDRCTNGQRLVIGQSCTFQCGDGYYAADAFGRSTGGLNGAGVAKCSVTARPGAAATTSRLLCIATPSGWCDRHTTCPSGTHGFPCDAACRRARGLAPPQPGARCLCSCPSGFRRPFGSETCVQTTTTTVTTPTTTTPEATVSFVLTANPNRNSDCHFTDTAEGRLFRLFYSWTGRLPRFQDGVRGHVYYGKGYVVGNPDGFCCMVSGGTLRLCRTHYSEAYPSVEHGIGICSSCSPVGYVPCVGCFGSGGSVSRASQATLTSGPKSSAGYPTPHSRSCGSGAVCRNRGVMDPRSCVCNCKPCPGGETPGHWCECKGDRGYTGRRCVIGPLPKGVPCMHGGVAVGTTDHNGKGCSCDCRPARSPLGTTGYFGQFCDAPRCGKRNYARATLHNVVHQAATAVPGVETIEKYYKLGGTSVDCVTGSVGQCVDGLLDFVTTTSTELVCKLPLLPWLKAACVVVSFGCDMVNQMQYCRTGNKHAMCGLREMSSRRRMNDLNNGRLGWGSSTSTLCAEAKSASEYQMDTHMREIVVRVCRAAEIRELGALILGDNDYLTVANMTCYMTHIRQATSSSSESGAEISASERYRFSECALPTEDQKSAQNRILTYVDRRAQILARAQMSGAFNRTYMEYQLSLFKHDRSLDIQSGGLWATLVKATRAQANSLEDEIEIIEVDVIQPTGWNIVLVVVMAVILSGATAAIVVLVRKRLRRGNTSAQKHVQLIEQM